MKTDINKFTDKYFLRTREILQKENLNPYMRAQVFIRKGPGVIAGLNEAVDFIDKNSDLRKNQGQILTLKDGEIYQSKETQMVIEGNIQDFVTLETQYLGIHSAQTTMLNDKINIDLNQITQNVAKVVEQLEGRPLIYFGARHWDFREDSRIAKAAFNGGAVGASTDVGAETVGEKGLGTIPHVLENVYAWKFGKDRAVVEATKAFDRHMDSSIPRIALIDYNNQEITDSLICAEEISSLAGFRVDTCGENVMQGAYKTEPENLKAIFGKKFKIPREHEKYWFGNGVTISGVYALRKALNENNYKDKTIMLTSGFGRIDKIEAFKHAEDILEMKLFDAVGAGTFFHSRAATMDVVAVRENNIWTPISKVGREFRPNHKLESRLI